MSTTRLRLRGGTNVLEAEEYLTRSGDRATVVALRPRLIGIAEYLRSFRNKEGLLQRLPRWVFVEWSAANYLVQDLNYPSNMMYAEVLDALDRLFGRPDMAEEARHVRELVRRQSWNGKWFCDNARFSPEGKPVPTGICTETCQYYAFYFKTATPETHPELWKTLTWPSGRAPCGSTTGRPRAATTASRATPRPSSTATCWA